MASHEIPRNISGSPIAPAAMRSFARAYPGSNRRWNPIWNGIPVRRTVSATASESSTEPASGFSANTALPISAARSMCSRCAFVGETTTIASISGSEINASASSTSGHGADPSASSWRLCTGSTAAATSVAPRTAPLTCSACSQPIRPSPITPTRRSATATTFLFRGRARGSSHRAQPGKPSQTGYLRPEIAASNPQAAGFIRLISLCAGIHPCETAETANHQNPDLVIEPLLLHVHFVLDERVLHTLLGRNLGHRHVPPTLKTRHTSVFLDRDINQHCAVDVLRPLQTIAQLLFRIGAERDGPEAFGVLGKVDGVEVSFEASGALVTVA